MYLQHDSKPVYRPAGKEWRRIPGPVTFEVYQYKIQSKENFYFQFTHKFGSETETSFALSFPFSYQDCLSKCTTIFKNFKDSKAVYFHHETAIYTLEGRKLQLLTISSFKNITEEREDLIPRLFPEYSEIKPRPFK